LLVLIKRQPPKGKKLLVIGTTSNKLVLDDMGLTDAFDATVSVPSLTTDEATAVIKEIEAFRVEDVDAACAMLDHQTPIKTLFVLLELARHGRSDHDAMDDANAISLDRWINCMEDLST
jgi:vesicle-fusing ATPase